MRATLFRLRQIHFFRNHLCLECSCSVINAQCVVACSCVWWCAPFVLRTIFLIVLFVLFVLLFIKLSWNNQQQSTTYVINLHTPHLTNDLHTQIDLVPMKTISHLTMPHCNNNNNNKNWEKIYICRNGLKHTQTNDKLARKKKPFDLLFIWFDMFVLNLNVELIIGELADRHEIQSSWLEAHVNGKPIHRVLEYVRKNTFANSKPIHSTVRPYQILLSPFNYTLGRLWRSHRITCKFADY